MNYFIILLLVIIEMTIIFKEPKRKIDGSEIPAGARAYMKKGIFHMIFGIIGFVVVFFLRKFADTYTPDSISDKTWLVLFIIFGINLIIGVILLVMSMITRRP